MIIGMMETKFMSGRTMTLATSVVLIFPCLISAQQKNGYGGGGPIAPPAGTVTIHPGLEAPGGTLDQQLRWSDIVVDGNVTAVLPSINVNPAIAGSVETASRVTINAVLHGQAAAGTEILVVELGGKQGQWNVIDPGNALVQSGERYILFLHAITKSIPNSSGAIPDSSIVPQYRVIGYANGKARVDAAGRIQFGSGATDSMLQYNNVPSNSFISLVAARVAHLFPTPPPYPVGVTPIAAPNEITPISAKKN